MRSVATSSILMLLLGGIAAYGQEKVLYSFPQAYSYPSDGVVADRAGNLYGAVSGGNSASDGAIFELSPTTTGSWTEKILFTFNGKDGNYPLSRLLIDSNGNLYGTTAEGGNGTCSNGSAVVGCGVVFELSKSSTGKWTEKILHQFQGGSADGSYPSGRLAFDAKGNLYGSTQEGGGTGCFVSVGCGTAYRLQPTSTGPWKEQILYRFTGGNDGSVPVGVALASGTVYGATEQSGASSGGVVFALKQSSGTWKYSIVYSFMAGTDGGNPNATVTVDSSGNLYGSTPAGGQYGWGTVFELSNSGGTWTEFVLYSFTGGSDGGSPIATPTRDSAGNLYGTTYTGGYTSECGWANPYDGCGVVFKLAPPAVQGQPWSETVLHDFSSVGGDANLPGDAGVIFGKGGLLYGATGYGGSGGCSGPWGTTNCGAVYRLNP